MADLIIRIGAESKEFTEELDKIASKTSDLEDQLSELAKISGVAFAALTAEAGLAIHAFGESEKASNKLSQALQNQGIYSKELADNYKEQASELQKLTGVDDDAIIKGQAMLQGMIGQTKITSEMSAAAVELGERLGGDVTQGFEVLGQAINGRTRGLVAAGIQIDENLTKEERMAQVIDRVTQALGDQATAANQGVGSIRGLKSAFSDDQEEIGARLAPAFSAIVKIFTEWLQKLKDNKPLLDLIVHVGTFVAVGAGMVTALTAGAAAFIKIRAAVQAAAAAFGIMRIGVAALVGATGIGLIAIIVTELILDWKNIWPKMQAIFTTFVDNISTLAGGLAKILIGAITLNPGKLSKGFDEIKAAFANGLKEYKDLDATNKKDLEKQEDLHQQKQNEMLKVAADKRAAEERRRASLEKQIKIEEQNQKLLTLQQGSEEQIKLQSEEISLLHSLETEKSAAVIQATQDRLAQVRYLEGLAQQEHADRAQEYFQTNLDLNAEYQALDVDQQALFIEQNQAALIAGTETEATIRRKAVFDWAKERQVANNQYLLDQQKFGTAYAGINKVMHSEIFQGTKTAFGNLAELQQSSNSTLKGIGKAAAVANIIIKTAESAMNIYAGFSIIPLIGPALGVAGAAAAVAFGAEQVQKVTAAADGGLITGGRAGRDSVPALLTPGELVVPQRNFADVVNAVAAQQNRNEGSNGSSIAGVEGSVGVAIAFDGDESEKVITARQVEARALGTLRQA